MTNFYLYSPSYYQASVPATKIPISFFDESCEEMGDTYTIQLIRTEYGSSYNSFYSRFITYTGDREQVASTSATCANSSFDISVATSNYGFSGEGPSSDLRSWTADLHFWTNTCPRSTPVTCYPFYPIDPVRFTIYEPVSIPASTSSAPYTTSSALDTTSNTLDTSPSPTQSTEMHTPEPTATNQDKQPKESSGRTGIPSETKIAVSVVVPGGVAISLVIGCICVRSHKKKKSSIPEDDSERPPNASNET